MIRSEKEVPWTERTGGMEKRADVEWIKGVVAGTSDGVVRPEGESAGRDVMLDSSSRRRH
jgi:hypothetical protein